MHRPVEKFGSYLRKTGAAVLKGLVVNPLAEKGAEPFHPLAAEAAFAVINEKRPI
jgi:hypothetical protein